MSICFLYGGRGNMLRCLVFVWKHVLGCIVKGAERDYALLSK